MSRITKEEIEKTKCGRFLLSDENIYLSIYSLNSYVFEYNLLNTEDRILYHQLQDKFDTRLINRVITRVRKQIIELLDEDKYIEAKVYFKPKKLSENGKLEFRPLHSTDLITQIAIVSMLHLFVYEIPEEEEGDPKLRLSNLSRLIPSDFYGNRVSVKPEYLFKPWKQQYQKYNQNSNDALMKYHTSLEYKYEVTLDLENFFPTINPIIIYHYVINHLPAYLNDEEREMMKRVLQKLLFCKLTTTFDEKTAKQYYKVTKGASNYDNVDKKERNEKECWDFKENSDKFVRGIPQGLPQSYFLGKYLSEKYHCEMDEHCTENVINMMTNEFPTSAAKKTYAQCIFLKKEQDDYGISDVYGKMLQNPEFCAILEELVDFGISRYKVNYSYQYQDTNLVLYQKYTYEDACRLLNWERNEVPLNIGGYKYDKKTKTFPIFINYDKQDNISDTTKYEDHFVAENRLIAISKSGRSMDSEDVQNFLKATERGIDVQLFVRKNKDDKISKEFYYLGRVIATGNAKQFVMPNTDKTAVEIEWELETPVREDIYQYIVNE